jgi:hypothetical protein
MNCTRKHTPIVSGKQRRLFGYWESNPSQRSVSITAEEIRSHLSESKGKSLPEKAMVKYRKRRKRK